MVPRMTQPIRRIAVLGAGVMGSGIAAHAANAGLPVLLLDINSKLAAGGLQKALKAKPAAFFHPGAARLVDTGNFDEHLAKVAGCDLIVEAIIERLDSKRALFEKLDAICTGTQVIASNTSGLRIADMVQGRSASFRSRFLITHFFNPPRYMKLLELVAGADTDPAVLERVTRWGREALGKGIVRANDTPNFIANRIGAHSMMATIHLMLEMGLSPEDVDAITGEPMGHPKSATFRTGDVVGIDTLVHVVDNCHQVLTGDEDREVFRTPDYIRQMIEKQRLGDKTGGGFYRKAGEVIETLDPRTGEYRAKGGDDKVKGAVKKIAGEPDLGKRLRALVGAEGVVGQFAWKVLSRSMAYAARRIGEITGDVAAIDEGMRWGYNWELGPFQTWDALGFAETCERMKADGVALPASIDRMKAAGAAGFYQGDQVWDLARAAYVDRPRDVREATLAILRRGGAPVLKNAGAEAWDLGQGVLGLTFKTKANSIDADVISMLGDAVARAEQDFRALVIYNGGDHFCVGANLFLVVMAAQQKKWEDIRSMVRAYQGATQRLKYAHVPVVSAPWGMTLGGGLELCLGSAAVQAAAETYSGLVEVGVGLIPGGAGTLNLLWRALESIPEGTDPDVFPFVAQVFKNIAMANVATSADAGKRNGYFRGTDGVSFDRARHLHETVQRAIGLAEAGWHPPAPRAHKPGESGIATIGMLINTLVAGGYATEHDGVIGRKLATVLCGGVSGHAHEVTESELLELEAEAFVSLCGEPKSQERMQHMLMKNKVLRN
jgi:3-hydroxyacyl-CoA dehydrogenase